MTVEDRDTGVWEPLRYGRFRALAAGELVTTLGNGVAPVALAFAVLDLTGSLADLGVVVGARTLANVLFVLVGGAVADRLPRRLVLVGSMLLAAASQAAVAASVLTHGATIVLLVGLSLVNGTAAAFAMPAALAMLPGTVPPPVRRRANAVQRVGRNLSTILGASLGGALVAAAGPGIGLAVDAASFLLAAGCYALVGTSAGGTAAGTAAGTGDGAGSLPRQLREGWAEVASRSWVWVVVLGFLVINACTAAAEDVLGPFVADGGFGRRGWGFVLAAQGAGLLVGALVALWVRADRLLLVGCASTVGLALLPLGLLVWPATVPLAVAAFAGGVGTDVFSVAWETSLQQHIPAGRLARVYAYDILGSVVAIPVAQVAVAPAVAGLGVPGTLVVVVVAVLGSVAAMVGAPGVRRLRQP